ncbi:MAG: ThiF family adenylyltransferase [Synergistaceae bacterium]|jgi:adenylyltransferase/sulfurtransferase|nr:ThiF family adenylyltransferase [Synergistaceae bacterium]
MRAETYAREMELEVLGFYHSTRDIDRPKVFSAKDRVKGLNPNVGVELYNTRLTSENAFDIMKGYDVAADGSDNYQTRYLVNDARVLLGIPNAYVGSVSLEDVRADFLGASDF